MMRWPTDSIVIGWTCPGTFGVRVCMVQPSCCLRISASAGDEVELVAFDVAKGRPARSALFDVAELVGAQADQARCFGFEVGADEVKVQSVLDRLRFGNLVKRQARSVHAFVVDQHDRVLWGWVLGNVAA